MNHTLLKSILAGLVLGATAVAGETDKKVITLPTPLDDSWRFSFALPAWAFWLNGDMGLNGQTAHIDLGPDNIIPKIDMAADVRAEARKGRFSVMGEFLYMSLSDGIGTNTVVKKLDVRVDQAMADLGFGWRVIEGPRGYLDVTAGVRYTNLYQRQTLQPNDERIDAVAGRLALAGTALRVLAARELAVLAGKDPSVPIAPLEGGEAARLTRAIAHLKGSTAERKAKIASLLHDSLNRIVSRTDDWWDPYVGLRGRYNLNEKFYLTAKGDIGGFTVGSDLTWQAEAALGVQLSKNMFTEIGYRALGVDYRKDGLVMDTVTHGPQLTLGILF
jgi:hypothetical protein